MEDVHVWCSTFKKPVIAAGAGTLLLEKAPSAPLSLWSTRSCCHHASYQRSLLSPQEHRTKSHERTKCQANGFLSSSAQSHHNVMCSSQFDCFADWAGKTMNLNQEMDWSHLWLTVHHPISWLTRLNKECVLLTEIAVVPTKAASHCATRRFGEQCWKSPFYPEQGQ